MTVAIYDYWQYFEPTRLYGPPDCIKNTQVLVDVVDKILLNETNAAKVQPLKEAFGLGNITDKRDFANTLNGGIYGLQSTNWDPKINSASFFNYCTNITDTPKAENLRAGISALTAAAGYDDDKLPQDVLLNAIAWLNQTSVSRWRRSGQTQDQYYTQLNATALQKYTKLSDYGQTSWSYQGKNTLASRDLHMKNFAKIPA